jgi:hypothetical protein
MIAAPETGMNSDQARQQAEKAFKQDKRARDGQRAMTNYEARSRDIREDRTLESDTLREAGAGAELQAREINGSLNFGLGISPPLTCAGLSLLRHVAAIWAAHEAAARGMSLLALFDR